MLTIIVYHLKFIYVIYDTGAAWGKWLTRIWVRNQTHDGAKMAAPAYRVPIQPIAPGQHDATWAGWSNDNMKIITQMLGKAMITKPGVYYVAICCHA